MVVLLATKIRFYPSVSASKNSVPDSDVRDRFDDGVGVGSSVPSSPTIQSDQTPDFQADPKQALSVGIFASIFLFFRSPVVFQNPAQMFFVQDNDVVQTLAPDRSDQSFGKAILPR